jgi:hypothetical protein
LPFDQAFGVNPYNRWRHLPDGVSNKTVAASREREISGLNRGAAEASK